MSSPTPSIRFANGTPSLPPSILPSIKDKVSTFATTQLQAITSSSWFKQQFASSGTPRSIDLAAQPNGIIAVTVTSDKGEVRTQMLTQEQGEPFATASTLLNRVEWIQHIPHPKNISRKGPSPRALDTQAQALLAQHPDRANTHLLLPSMDYTTEDGNALFSMLYERYAQAILEGKTPEKILIPLLVKTATTPHTPLQPLPTTFSPDWLRENLTRPTQGPSPSDSDAEEALEELVREATAGPSQPNMEEELKALEEEVGSSQKPLTEEEEALLEELTPGEHKKRSSDTHWAVLEIDLSPEGTTAQGPTLKPLCVHYFDPTAQPPPPSFATQFVRLFGETPLTRLSSPASGQSAPDDVHWVMTWIERSLTPPPAAASPKNPPPKAQTTALLPPRLLPPLRGVEDAKTLFAKLEQLNKKEPNQCRFVVPLNSKNGQILLAIEFSPPGIRTPFIQVCGIDPAGRPAPQVLVDALPKGAFFSWPQMDNPVMSTLQEALLQPDKTIQEALQTASLPKATAAAPSSRPMQYSQDNIQFLLELYFQEACKANPSLSQTTQLLPPLTDPDAVLPAIQRARTKTPRLKRIMVPLFIDGHWTLVLIDTSAIGKPSGFFFDPSGGPTPSALHALKRNPVGMGGGTGLAYSGTWTIEAAKKFFDTKAVPLRALTELSQAVHADIARVQGEHRTDLAKKPKEPR